jgi:acyl carrier protein
VHSIDFLEITRSMIAQVLALDLHEVEPHSRFSLDLRGESIDLLELGFLIEKQLRLKVDFGRLFSAGAIETDDSGVITHTALARIRIAMPYLDFHRLPQQPTPQALFDELLTVSAIAEIIRTAAAAQPAPAVAPLPNA